MLPAVDSRSFKIEGGNALLPERLLVAAGAHMKTDWVVDTITPAKHGRYELHATHREPPSGHHDKHHRKHHHRHHHSHHHDHHSDGHKHEKHHKHGADCKHNEEVPGQGSGAEPAQQAAHLTAGDSSADARPEVDSVQAGVPWDQVSGECRCLWGSVQHLNSCSRLYPSQTSSNA